MKILTLSATDKKVVSLLLNILSTCQLSQRRICFHNFVCLHNFVCWDKQLFQVYLINTDTAHLHPSLVWNWYKIGILTPKPDMYIILKDLGSCIILLKVFMDKQTNSKMTGTHCQITQKTVEHEYKVTHLTEKKS